MSISSILRYFTYFPTKTRRFTIHEIARYGHVSHASVYITIRKLKQRGIVTTVMKSRGKGRGRGKTQAVYTFTEIGLYWLRKHNIMV